MFDFDTDLGDLIAKYGLEDGLDPSPADPGVSKDPPPATTKSKDHRRASVMDRLARAGIKVTDADYDDFERVAGLESGRSHWTKRGVVKRGAPTKDGARAIGYGQIMPGTAAKYRQYGMDPFDETDNRAMSLVEFARGGDDPISRRLAYVGGPKSAALAEYKRTGKVSKAKLYSYLPDNKETYESYVRRSGGFDSGNKVSNGGAEFGIGPEGFSTAKISVGDNGQGLNQLEDENWSPARIGEWNAAYPGDPQPGRPQRLGQMAQAEVNRMLEGVGQEALSNAPDGKPGELAVGSDGLIQLPGQGTQPKQTGAEGFEVTGPEAAQAAYQEFLRQTGLKPGLESLTEFNTVQETLGKMRLPTQEEAQARLNASDQPGQSGVRASAQGLLELPQGPMAQRVPSAWQTVAKAKTDAELDKTHARYRVDLRNVRGNKTEYALQAVRNRLMQEYQIDQQTAGRIAGAFVSDITEKDPYIIANIPRGDIAQVLGRDAMRAQYERERAPAEMEILPGYLAAAEKQNRQGPTSPLGLPGFEQMSQAERNVAMDPFSEGTQKDIRAEQRRLDAVTPTTQEREAFIKATDEWVGPGAGSAMMAGLTGATGRTIQSLAGVMRLATGAMSKGHLGTAVYPDWLNAMTKQGIMAEDYEAFWALQNPGAVNTALRVTGSVAGDTPRYLVMARLPGGMPVLFAADEGLRSAGRGERWDDNVKAIGKGAALGAIFSGASKVAAAVESFTGRAINNPVFGNAAKGSPRAANAPAFLQDLPAEARQAFHNLGGLPGLTSTPKERLAARLFGEGARIGTIFSGAATAARLEDDGQVMRDEEGNIVSSPTGRSLEAGMVMALTDLAMRGAASVDLSNLIGRIFRGSKDGRTIHATVTPEGDIKLLKGAVGDKFVDIDMVFDPVSKMYKAQDPFRGQPKQIGSDIVRAEEGRTQYKESPSGRAKTRFEDAQAGREGDARIQRATQEGQIEKARRDREAAERSQFEKGAQVYRLNQDGFPLAGTIVDISDTSSGTQRAFVEFEDGSMDIVDPATLRDATELQNARGDYYQQSTRAGAAELGLSTVDSPTLKHAASGRPVVLERPTANAVEILNQLGFETGSSGYMAAITPDTQGVGPSFAVHTYTTPSARVKRIAKQHGLEVTKHPKKNGGYYISAPDLKPEDQEKATELFDAFARDLAVGPKNKVATLPFAFDDDDDKAAAPVSGNAGPTLETQAAPGTPTTQTNVEAPSSQRPTISRDQVLRGIKLANPNADLEATRQLLPEGDYESVELPISEIGEVYGKAGKSKVADYANRPAGTTPPIVVDAKNNVVDGKHRVAAAKKRGDQTVKAWRPVQSKGFEMMGGTGPHATTAVGRLKEQRDAERRRAEVNPLTGLGSKNSWTVAQPRIEADPNQQIGSFDLNRMKEGNDTTSHDTVDREVLARLGEAVKTVLDRHKIPHRNAFTPGGDELYVALPKDGAIAIRNEIEKEFGTVELVAERDYTNARTGETFSKGDIIPITLSGTVGQTVKKAERGLRSRKEKSKAANPVQRAVKAPTQMEVDWPPGSENWTDEEIDNYLNTVQTPSVLYKGHPLREGEGGPEEQAAFTIATIAKNWGLSLADAQVEVQKTLHPQDPERAAIQAINVADIQVIGDWPDAVDEGDVAMAGVGGAPASPLMRSMAARRDEARSDAAEIADRFGADLSDVESTPILSEPGDFGWIKYQMSQYLLDPINEDVFNDAAAALLGEDDIVFEMIGGDYKDRQAVVAAMMDVLANQQGIDRSSQMTAEQWDEAIIANAPDLPIEAVEAMVTAGSSTAQWHKNHIDFINDPDLKEYIFKARAGDLEKGDERKILAIGRRYGKDNRGPEGLSDDIIRRAFAFAVSGRLPNSAVQRSSERAGQSLDPRRRDEEGPSFAGIEDEPTRAYAQLTSPVGPGQKVANPNVRSMGDVDPHGYGTYLYGRPSSLQATVAAEQELISPTLAQMRSPVQEVTIAAPEDSFMHWDKPLWKQSDRVIEALKKEPKLWAWIRRADEASKNELTGGEVYDITTRYLKNLLFQSGAIKGLEPTALKHLLQKTTSDWLVDRGIRGNKFYDPLSQGQGEDIDDLNASIAREKARVRSYLDVAEEAKKKDQIDKEVAARASAKVFHTHMKLLEAKRDAVEQPRVNNYVVFNAADIRVQKVHDEQWPADEIPMDDSEVHMAEAWHGTPHAVHESEEGRFTTKKIGTGEGAQVFGYGLYFAGKEKVADYYRNSLSPSTEVFYRGELVEPFIAGYGTASHRQQEAADEVAQRLREGRSFGEAIRTAKEFYQDLLDTQLAILGRQRSKAARWADPTKAIAAESEYAAAAEDTHKALVEFDQLQESDFEIKRGGYKYKVELKPAEEDYLRWDLPLNEQSEKVRARLLDPISDVWKAGRARMTGKDVYRLKVRMFTRSGHPNPKQAASQDLKEDGIRGIKFPAGSLWGKEDGSFNYVIFDDDDVEIKEIHQARAEALRLLNSYNNSSMPAIAGQHRAQILPNDALFVSAQGTQIFRRLLEWTYPDKTFGTPGGMYLRAGQAQNVQASLGEMRSSYLERGDAVTARHLNDLADVMEKAIDPVYGDLIVLADLGADQGSIMKSIEVEEFAHRADHRARLVQHLGQSFYEALPIENFQAVQAYQRTARLLRDGFYKGGSDRLIHNEIIAQIFRPDALEKLQLTEAERGLIERLYLGQLLDAGITPQKLIEFFEGVDSVYAKNFTETARAIEGAAQRSAQRLLAEAASPTPAPSTAIQGGASSDSMATPAVSGGGGGAFDGGRRGTVTGGLDPEDGPAFSGEVDDSEAPGLRRIIDNAIMGWAPEFLTKGDRISGGAFAANTVRSGLLAAIGAFKMNLYGNPINVIAEELAHVLGAGMAWTYRKATGNQAAQITGRTPSDILSGLKNVIEEGFLGTEHRKSGVWQALWRGVDDSPESQRYDLDDPFARKEDQGQGLAQLQDMRTELKVPFILSMIMQETVKRIFIAIDRPFSAFSRGTERHAQTRAQAKALQEAGVAGTWSEMMEIAAKQLAPSAEELAIHAGQVATFQNSNLVTDTADRLRGSLTTGAALAGRTSAAQQAAARLIGQGLYVGLASEVPFVRTSSNIGNRTAEYFPPFGALKGGLLLSAAGKQSMPGWVDKILPARREGKRPWSEVFDLRQKGHALWELEDRWAREDKKTRAARTKEAAAINNPFKKRLDAIDEQVRKHTNTKQQRDEKIRRSQLSADKRIEALDKNAAVHADMLRRAEQARSKIRQEREVLRDRAKEQWGRENEARKQAREKEYHDQADFQSKREYHDAFMALGRGGLGTITGALFIYGLVQGLIYALGDIDYDDEQKKWEKSRDAGIPEGSVLIPGIDYRWPMHLAPITRILGIYATAYDQASRPGTTLEKTRATANALWGRGLLTLNPYTDPTFSEGNNLGNSEFIGKKALTFTPGLNARLWSEISEVLDDTPRTTYGEGFFGPLNRQLPPGLEYIGHDVLPSPKHPMAGRGDMSRRAMRLFLEPPRGSFELKPQSTLPMKPLTPKKKKK